MAFLSPLSPTFDAALRDVRAKGEELRLAAAVVLAEPEPGRADEAIEGLRVLARDASARVRAAAIDSMGRLGDRALLPVVLAALDDPSPAVREMAMAAAAALGGPEAEAAVRDGLRSEHPEVRFQALCALASRPIPGLERAVAELLEDDDPEVAAEAATTLAAMGAEAFAGAVAARLDDARPPVRDAAALALAHLGDARAVPRLREMVRRRRSPLEAIEALGALGAAEAADDLAAAGSGFFTPLVLRAAAGAALARVGDPRGVPMLRSVLRALRSDGRAYAVEQVGALRLAPLADELARLAERPRGVERGALVEALRALAGESPEARGALARLERAEASHPAP